MTDVDVAKLPEPSSAVQPQINDSKMIELQERLSEAQRQTTVLQQALTTARVQSRTRPVRPKRPVKRA